MQQLRTLFKIINIDTGTTMMMLIMSTISLLKNLNRYIQLAESLCSANSL